MLLTRVSAKAPKIALQMPKRNRKPSTNQAAILKQATAIMKVKIPDNKSKVARGIFSSHGNVFSEMLKYFTRE